MARRLHSDLGGAKRHGHVDLVDRPRHPHAAIEPRLAIGEPRFVADEAERGGENFVALAVRALRIGEIARGVDLVRADFLEQRGGEISVLAGPAAMALRRGVVKGQVEKMESFLRHAAGPAPRRATQPADGRADAHGIGDRMRRIHPHVLEEICVALDHFVAHLALPET